jgi:hypothetical protein
MWKRRKRDGYAEAIRPLRLCRPQTLATVLLILCLGQGCDRRNTATTPTAGTEINRAGTYVLASGRLELNVREGDNGNLQYKLRRVADGQNLFSGSAGSPRHRWCVFFDDEERLWVHSSDIGDWVWLPSDGTYSKHTIRMGEKLPAPVPKGFLDCLPQSMKRELSGN